MAPDSRRRSRLAIAICVATGLYWLVIFVLTHAPVEPTPEPPDYSLDKVAHVGAFAGLAVLLCAAGTALGYSSRWVIMGTIAIVAAYGIFDELTQQFVLHREPDVFDWTADMLGAGIGVTLFSIAREVVLAIGRRVTAA